MESNFTPQPNGLINRFKKLLSENNGPRRLEGAETAGNAEPDLSEGAIKGRAGEVKATLDRVIKEHLGDKPKLYEIADKLCRDGGEAMRLVRAGDEHALNANNHLLAGLEAIIKTDGTRPSFMVRYGKVDMASSPLGNWDGPLINSEDTLNEAIKCVGRINDPASTQGFQGTGFLVQKNIIITNRHVLQLIADQQNDGTWKIHPDITIDFGHEFSAIESINPRAITKVIFAATSQITDPLDHKKLDLAVLELEPANNANTTYFSINIAPQLVTQGKLVYTIGYAGKPPNGIPLSLLDELFMDTYGCKRLAPGEIIKSGIAIPGFSLAHDATTLGGNSGSAIVVIGKEKLVAALHYGGRYAEPSENWGHKMDLILNNTDANGQTLKECLAEHDVEFIDVYKSRLSNTQP